MRTKSGQEDTQNYTSFRKRKLERGISGKRGNKKMKLVWTPETAAKAYIDTVKSCRIYQESSVAEMVSAMAAGWDAKFIVETWSKSGAITTSIGLAVATSHTCGRHVCIVRDEESRSEYLEAMGEAGTTVEVLVGEAEEVMGGLEGIDFMVVDCNRNDFDTILRLAKLGHRGAVLICKNASKKTYSGFGWTRVVDGGRSRVVRAVYLPVGKGLDIAHIATGGGGSAPGRRWLKHVDQKSGEEHVIRTHP